VAGETCPKSLPASIVITKTSPAVPPVRVGLQNKRK
jgi:hypothetical protein